MGRLLIVSNRLPVTAHFRDNRVQVDASSGGLATGLRGPHEEYGGLWIGWPGELPRLEPSQRAEFEQLLAEEHAFPIYLSREETRDFYEDIANGTIWPVFHYLIDQETMHTRGWDTYRSVNQKFAQAVADHYQPGDLVWVHDYHLMLVPGMVRALIPEARIGFFLHIPFPSSEVFAVLPWRHEILEGILASDLIGFHTSDYARHFSSSVRRLLGLETLEGQIHHGGHVAMIGAFPMGIDTDAWEERASEPEVRVRAEEIREDADGRSIVLGIDRLDFSKGLVRRFIAIEALLRSDPSLVEKTRFIQVMVPSREAVESYASLRRRINELTGRINATYATASAVPVHVLYRSFDEAEVSALYCSADVMLVTPVRDGMNLVAKEFVASRVDEDGVLVLSEFAGAAEDLQQALLVNPYDAQSIGSNIRRALSMSRNEKRSRMQVLRQHVRETDVHKWAAAFIATLERKPTSAA